MVINMDKSSQLTELPDARRRLLQKYYDGEASIVEKWQVKRLLARSDGARAYLDLLEEVTTQVRDHHFEQVRGWNSSLWERIDRRIDEEERAELLLGKRTFELSTPASQGSMIVPWFGRVAWGTGGACFASLVIVLMFGMSSSTTPSALISAHDGTSSPISSTESGVQTEFRTVSLASDPTPSSTSLRPPVEIDWLHSDGTVHLIHSHEKRIPTIWVKRQRVPLNAPLARSKTKNEVPLVINVSNGR
jgi:hypothetical protein